MTWKHFGGGDEESYRKIVRRTTADKFLKELIVIDLLNWKSEYVDNDILDGIQWSIEIMRKERNLKNHASNDYPKNWRLFCDLMGRISGRKFG